MEEMVALHASDLLILILGLILTKSFAIELLAYELDIAVSVSP